MSRVIKQIQPIDEDELVKDLLFALHNRSQTDEQFIDELLPIVRFHVNEAMIAYQEGLLDDLSRYFRGEIVSVIMRSRRETIVERAPVNNEETGNDTEKESSLAW